MFIFSISFIEAFPVAHIEFFLMYFAKNSLLFLDNFFESLSNFLLIVLFSITAAA